MRLGAQPFFWKWVLFIWEWKMIFISKAEHPPSFWNRGPGELGNGLFASNATLIWGRRLFEDWTRQRTDHSRIPVNKGTNWRLGWTNTVICMKLFTRPSTSFLYVCSLERNAGKVYWINYDTIISRIKLTELTSSDLNYIRATVDCEQLVRGEHARLVPTVTRVFIFVSRASRLTD